MLRGFEQLEFIISTSQGFDVDFGMIYLAINRYIMKLNSQTIRIVFWIILGIAILLSGLGLSGPLPVAQDATPTPTIISDTIISAAEAREDAGSTDGIVLIAAIIVLIVIVPILLRRQAWSNRKRK